MEIKQTRKYNIPISGKDRHQAKHSDQNKAHSNTSTWKAQKNKERNSNKENSKK